MKILYILLLSWFVPVKLLGQEGFYSIGFKSMDGTLINMSSFSGKKVVVAVCSAANPDVSHLRMLDTLATNNPNAQVIVVPVSDFDAGPINRNLKALVNDSLALNYVIGEVGRGRKMASEYQLPLLIWLTHVSSAIHFDNDLQAVSQFFVVDERGALFAVLNDLADPLRFLEERILNRPLPAN